MVTRESFDKALQTLDPTSDAYKLLYLLNISPDPDVQATYEAKNATLILHGQAHPIHPTLRNPFTTSGIIFLTSKGKPYTDRTFTTFTNGLLNEVLGSPLRTVRAMLRPVQERSTLAHDPGPRSEWIPFKLELCDPDIAKALANVDLYHKGSYPFIPIYHPEYDITIRYDVYRYVAYLPYDVSSNTEWKFATVDHIHHNVSDHRRISLRYCTTKQNSQNICGSSDGYHGVNINSEVLTKSFPDNVSKFVRAWCSLITIDMMDTYAVSQAPYIYIDTESCRGAKLNSIPASHISFMDAFIKDMLASLKALGDQEYTNSVLRSTQVE